MACTRRSFVWLASTALLGLASCSKAVPQPEEPQPDAEPEEEKPAEPEVDLNEFQKLALDSKAWEYDEENDVFYQLGVPYCLEPAADAYESLAVFVPGPYLKREENGRSRACVVNHNATVGSFTPATAPVVMPINSGNLGPQASPTSYSYAGLANYLSAGCVYVYAGFRGRSSGYESGSDDLYAGGDPWPVVDLKAAVRFLRYNAGLLPCNTDRIFTFGFSAGGGVSAVMGASGGSELYLPYLQSIGAATHDAEGAPISDDVFGSASWCPITSFDTADASYEWMMGQYSSEGTRAEGTWTKLLSNDLAAAYAAYINDMDLRDADDQPLALDETSGEIFADGSYYLHLKECIEDSATSFFANTQFPYTYTPQHLVNASFPGDPNLQSMGAGALDIEAVTGDASAQAAGVGSQEGMTEVQSVVFNTPSDYVNHLNANKWWLTYNQTRGTARITSLGDFVRQTRAAAKGVCAFDAPDRSTVENQLFGVGETGSLHFSGMIRDQLVSGRETYRQGDGWQKNIVRGWLADLAKTDSLGTSMSRRMNMFNPLYFLSGYYDGFGSATVAPHWRINSGLFQTDTSLCTETNLALALGKYEGVEDVSFNAVWGQGHVLAEMSGSAEENFVSWVRDCCG